MSGAIQDPSLGEGDIAAVQLLGDGHLDVQEAVWLLVEPCGAADGLEGWCKGHRFVHMPKRGATTGISTQDRAATIAAMIDPGTKSLSQ